MRRVTADGVEFEVVWDGSLDAVQAPDPPPLPQSRTGTFGHAERTVLAYLRVQMAGVRLKRSTIAKATGLENSQVDNVLYKLHRRNRIIHGAPSGPQPRSPLVYWIPK